MLTKDSSIGAGKENQTVSSSYGEVFQGVIMKISGHPMKRILKFDKARHGIE